MGTDVKCAYFFHIEKRNDWEMRRKKNIAPCQGYRGWADIEKLEYKYPLKKSQKYVLRLALVGSSPRVWREIDARGQVCGICLN